MLSIEKKRQEAELRREGGRAGFFFAHFLLAVASSYRIPSGGFCRNTDSRPSLAEPRRSGAGGENSTALSRLRDAVGAE